uniref:TBC1 domain family, member 10A n=1 Tax=Nothobranchius pienaari TaxID=704102 RepID=A0A1A8LH38_9TELE
MAEAEQDDGLEIGGSTEKLTDGEKGTSRGSNNSFTEDKQVDKYGFLGGSQQSATEEAEEIPSDVLRQRELKWLEMLKSWDKWMAKKHKKVKERCQKGIPPSLRGRAWLYLTGGKAKKEQNRNKFEELKNHPGDPKWLDVIERDLHRQFPFHEMFASKGGLGQQDLLDVLKAYTVYRSEEGYCQAQAPIAALLLMHMPAEDAFWTLVQICEKYIPGYYSTGLEAIQLDGEILFSMLCRVSPVAHRHLKKQNVEPVLYMTEWFMCAFCRTLPWASVLRVWDMFLCEGVKILFKVGLVLLKYSLGTQEKLKGCHGLYETMELLRSINPQYTHEAFLVHEIMELKISEKDIEKEHQTQLHRWKESHGDLRCKSPPRMHGAKAIITAEPPNRLELKQTPTIIVDPFLPNTADQENADEPKKSLLEPEKARGSRKTKKKNGHISTLPPPEVFNPHPSPNGLSLGLKPEPIQGSKESLASNDDTYL